MKRKYIAILTAIALLPVVAFAQTPPAPPAPPSPPLPPQDRHEKSPKVPVTFLGVDTSPVPPVVCEQMNLAKGFGLVVDYVVPDSPAAGAGVQQNDILKMLNDQILLEPSQLAKLIRSYGDGTTITLTILRKGQEQKLTVKLAKKEMPQRREFGPRHGESRDHDFGDLRERIDELKDHFGDGEHGMVHDAVMTAQAEAQRVRDEAQRRDVAQQIRDAAQQAREYAQRVRDQVRQAAGQISITKTDDTGLKSTKIDIGKAQIVFSDVKGELRIDNGQGKKVLTAKDPQGRLLFSGPVETKEDLDKVPAEVRQRYENLKEHDLPSVVSSEEEDDDDDDSADMDDNDSDDSEATVERVSICPPIFQHGGWICRTV